MRPIRSPLSVAPRVAIGTLGLLGAVFVTLGASDGRGFEGPWPAHAAAQEPSPEPTSPLVEARAQTAPIGAFADSVIAAYMESDRIPGAVFVLVRDGEIVHARGYGVADLESGRPVSADETLFRIGSISKLFTLLALVQLADRGALSLDDDVNAYLDPPLVDDRFAPVTFRHLLTHSAGFDQVGLRRQAASPGERPSLRAFLARELRRVRPPGEVGTYDTYGATLAGHLIEAIGGRPYAEHMRDEVFVPLGMASTFVETPDSLRGRLALGYGLDGERFTPQPYEWYVTLPASSIDATATDMARLMIALLGDGGGFLSAEAANAIRQPQGEHAPGFPSFSYGFWEATANGRRAIHHGGTMRGFESELYLVPEADVGFFLAYNRDLETGPAPRLRDALTRALVDRLFPAAESGRESRAGAEAETPTEPGAEAGATEPGAWAAVWAGRLEGAYASTVACFTCGGRGWTPSAFPLREPGPGVVQLWGRRWLARDSLTFQVEGGRSRIGFRTDGRGRVRYLLYQNTAYARLDEPLFEELSAATGETGSAEYLSALGHMALDEWSEAAGAYEAVASARPDDGRSRYYAGYAALQAGEAERAIRNLEGAIERGQWVSDSEYFMGAAHAAAGRPEDAFAALRRAYEAGFRDRERLAQDRWWSELRDDPRLAEVFSAGEREREAAMAEFAARPATIDPVGRYELDATPNLGGEARAVRVTLVIAEADGELGGSFSLDIEPGEMPLSRIAVGGNEVWAVAELPFGSLDVRLVVDGTRVTGRMSGGPIQTDVEGVKSPG